MLIPLMAEMLTRSDTFRGQVDRLAAASHVVVAIGFGTTSQLGGDSARSQLMLRAGALERAEIWVTPIGARSVETISHEIEHVIEGLEGGRLAGPGVARRLDGSFETVRAIEIGRLVADEFRARSR